MSHEPEPPACIAKALAGRVVFHDEVAEVARAVWDALLAEGEVIGWRGGGRSLCIPLPVVEPRDASRGAS